jgi:hypothetical protein
MTYAASLNLASERSVLLESIKRAAERGVVGLAIIQEVIARLRAAHGELSRSYLDEQNRD